MTCTIEYRNKKYKTDLSSPLDISIPFREGKNSVNAYYAPPFRVEPVKIGNWIGEVKMGAPVNYRNVHVNPHGNGTHTECVGHIIKENFTVNQCMNKFFFLAELISVKPEISGKDKVIRPAQLLKLKGKKYLEDGAVVIRTLPNSTGKLIKKYSGANPPYFHEETLEFLNNLKIRHLLVDLPSVDKEMDEGKLAAHKMFWNLASENNSHSLKTITELVYIPGKIKDGTYFVDLQVAPFENDASPSRPVLYAVEKVAV